MPRNMKVSAGDLRETGLFQDLPPTVWYQGNIRELGGSRSRGCGSDDPCLRIAQ